MIREEGVNSLTWDELQAALRARGMKTTGTVVTLRKRLTEWLDLTLTHNLPTSLLVLSRAFLITENEKYEALKETLASLPEELVEEVKVKIEQVPLQHKLVIISHYLFI
jgi:LETM1 and EF-hand domain-containing protein 1